MATGDIENETLLGWINPVNRFFDDIQGRASRVPLMFVPESSHLQAGWDVLHYSQQAHLYQEMRRGQDFVGCATNMTRIPTNYYELGIIVAPLSTAAKVFKPLSTGLKAAGRGAENALKRVPIFDIRKSGVQNVVDSTSFSPHIMQDLLQFHYPDAIITSTTLPARGMRGTAQKTLKTTAATSRKGKEKVVDAGKRKNWNRSKNKLPAEGTPSSTVTNSSGTTVRKYGANGKSQKEYNKGHSGKSDAPKYHKEDHIHDYKPNPRHPKGRPIRMPGREIRNKDKVDLNLFK